MPMYLLEEDEGNDEEIIRLLSTPLENNLSQDDTQQSTTPNFVPARCEVNRVGATQSQQPNDTEANTHLQDELSNLKIHQQDDSNGTLARTQYGANAPTAQSICVSEINLLEVDANQVRELDSSINKKDPLLPFKGPSAQGNSNSQKSKESFLSGAQTESLRKSSVSVMFPWMGNLSPIGLTVTPVQVLPNLQSASPPPRKKIRHGGGWPKGKSRKPDHVPSPPPKPPSTGYGIFLSEHMASERSKFTSMSQVSKELGRLWSELTSEEKQVMWGILLFKTVLIICVCMLQVYHQRSDVERERYLSELRQYLSSSANSDHCLKQLNRFLSQVSATERDDNVLVCDVCNISFTSLHNKRCHYSGKMHMQTLLKNVQQKQHKLPEENYGSERTSTALSTQKLPITGDALASCLCKEAEKYTGMTFLDSPSLSIVTFNQFYADCITELRSVDDGYQLSLQTLATLQQASAEQEVSEIIVIGNRPFRVGIELSV